MSILKSFVPFIAYAVVASSYGWRAGIAVGLVALVVVTLTTSPRRLGVLGIAQATFLVAAGVFAVLRPDSGLQDNLNSIGMAWIAVVSAVSLMVGHPFTLDYSTDGVEPEIAKSELFMQINRTIAWVWTACFAACAAAGVAATALDQSSAGTVTNVVLLIAAIKFTSAYPDRAVAAATGPAVAKA